MTAPASTAPAAAGGLWAGSLLVQRSLLLPLLLVLFFGSGISGLIYELVWLRYLTLVFGVTVYAVSTVLSAFMGGLALGGYLAGRVADRVRRPFRVYGLLELGIGVSALLTPPAFALLHSVYEALYPSLPHDLTSLSLVRFVLACAILLVPTTLMGATLPIVVRSTLGRSGTLGTNLSLLYASNTAGGITGAYLAGFILIGSIGIRATTVSAAVINIAIGVVSLGLDWWLHRDPSPAEGTAGAAAGPLPAAPAGTAALLGGLISPAAARWLLIAFFVSGFASLGYQVIWTRILAIFFEATTYAFTLILCTFLLGIAAGSYLISPVINRRAHWLLWAAAMEWAIGVTALLSLAVISRLHAIVDTLRSLPVLEHVVSGEQRVIALMCFVTIVPTTLLLGAAFPVIMKLYAGGTSSGPEGGSLGRRLGRAYAANVCGSIAGAWASGFVLIPLLGTHRSAVLLAAANVFVGLMLVRYALGGLLVRRTQALVAAGLAMAIGAAALTPDMYGAVFKRFGGDVLWYEEGLEQTVTIIQEPQTRLMYLNGWHQANDSPSMLRIHTLLGHLPMLMQPGTPATGTPPRRDVLVIGLGGGATAGAASAYDGVRLRVVELSPSVVRGARYFSHVNNNVVDAPNVHIHTDDGRNYLMLTDERYDVIMADAIRPQHAGSSALYSAEYYRLAYDALKDDGVMVQWIDGAIPANQYRMLLRTFLEVFPYVTAWADGAFFIGSKQPYRIDKAVLAQRLGGSARTVLEPVGITSPEAVLSLFTATDGELRSWVGDGPIITDDHPYVEFFRSLRNDPEPADVSRFRRDPTPILR